MTLITPGDDKERLLMPSHRHVTRFHTCCNDARSCINTHQVKETINQRIDTNGVSPPTRDKFFSFTFSLTFSIEGLTDKKGFVRFCNRKYNK